MTACAGISLADFARVMGVDRAQPTRWKERGMPTLPDGTVAPVAGAEWVRGNVDTYKLRGSVGAVQMAQAERWRYEREAARAQYYTIELYTEILARDLSEVLPEDKARAVVKAMHRRVCADTIRYLDTIYPGPPPGFASWAEDDPWSDREDEHLLSDPTLYRDGSPVSEGDWNRLYGRPHSGNPTPPPAADAAPPAVSAEPARKRGK